MSTLTNVFQFSKMSCQTPEEKSRCPWKIFISDLKSSDQLLETKVFFGKVVQKSGLCRYQNQNGTIKHFLDLGVADETASVKVRVYKKELLQYFKEGWSYTFRDVINDKDMVKVIQSSTVALTGPVNVPKELELEAQKLIYPESELYSINEAKKCPDKTILSVEGTVEEIAPVEQTKVSYQLQKKERQRLKLKDETGSIWICMWGEKTKQCKDLSPGDVVQLANMKVNSYYGDITLNSTVSTNVSTNVFTNVSTNVFTNVSTKNHKVAVRQ